MRVTCLTIRIILHIAYYIFHIIRSYAMRPWNHGLDIQISQNEGSTYETSTRESSLESTESASFIHMYFISFHSYASVNAIHTHDIF